MAGPAGALAAAFNNSWLWPVLGLVFVPWLTLMYVLVAPGGIVGFDWVWLGLALVGDIGSYSGGGYGNRSGSATATRPAACFNWTALQGGRQDSLPPPLIA